MQLVGILVEETLLVFLEVQRHNAFLVAHPADFGFPLGNFQTQGGGAGPCGNLPILQRLALLFGAFDLALQPGNQFACPLRRVIP